MLERAEALCVCRPSGTGKSHLVEALGHLAIAATTVAWHTLESLAVMLRRHRADDSVSKAIARVIRADLSSSMTSDAARRADAAEALFRVVDAAYEKRSIALTSNIHPAGFDELMPKTLAPDVDRLFTTRTCSITDGTHSYRLAQATAGRSEAPHLHAQRVIAAPPRPTGSARVDDALGSSDGRHWGETMTVDTGLRTISPTITRAGNAASTSSRAAEPAAGSGALLEPGDIRPKWGEIAAEGLLAPNP